jgi:hypothetical protein
MTPSIGTLGRAARLGSCDRPRRPGRPGSGGRRPSSCSYPPRRCTRPVSKRLLHTYEAPRRAKRPRMMPHGGAVPCEVAGALRSRRWCWSANWYLDRRVVSALIEQVSIPIKNDLPSQNIITGRILVTGYNIMQSRTCTQSYKLYKNKRSARAAVPRTASQAASGQAARQRCRIRRKLLAGSTAGRAAGTCRSVPCRREDGRPRTPPRARRAAAAAAAAADLRDCEASTVRIGPARARASETRLRNAHSQKHAVAAVQRSQATRGTGGAERGRGATFSA